MAQRTLIVKAVDYDFAARWDYVPTPGEAFVLIRPETDEKFIKIGDGKTCIGNLPIIFNSQEEEMKQRPIDETCANCSHLCVINRNKIYAVCDETGKTFELWRMDTRDSDACSKFAPKEDGRNQKCPHCGRPMRWVAGNPIFTYWECKYCNREFEYNVWTETFHDED